MKMSMLKGSLLLLTLFALTALTSCKKDDDDLTAGELKEKIEGAWDVTSFKYGGIEFMNTVIDSAFIEYKAFTGPEGDFIQRVTYLDGEPDDVTEGTYALPDGASVKMTADGESYTLKVTINGDVIKLDGKQDGQSLVVTAEKRD